MSNTFGECFKITTFGESHGPAVGVVIDGCPPRLPLDVAEIQAELNRRRPGQSEFVSPRQEADQVEILSGLFDGHTLGTPIALMVRNADARSGDYANLENVYRPSHADYTTEAKYGIRDPFGGGRASARETLARVAAGAIARKLLDLVAGIEVVGWVDRVQNISAQVDPTTVTRSDVEAASSIRCPDKQAALAMEKLIASVRSQGDSVGGALCCVARNVEPGLGAPVFDKLEADLAKAMLSIPAVKGFEIGSGFAGTYLTGSQHNDEFVPPEAGDGRLSTLTNNSGGVQGGISNGEDILVTVAFKPTASIGLEQRTVNSDLEPVTTTIRGRHDPCVLPRAVPIVEAMMCLVLADHWLRQQTMKVVSGTPSSSFDSL